MDTVARKWWCNCTDQSDEEMRAIDALEDSLGALDPDTRRIRGLIGCMESCHHKAVRHAEIILEAIATGTTAKGQGRRDAGYRDPREKEYAEIIESLKAWCDRGAANDLTATLGERTPLKVWQVQKVIEKVRGFNDLKERWGRAQQPVVDAPEAPPAFREATKAFVVHDTDNNHPAEITLARAIDSLTGCNWNFIQNVRIILGAIGGNARPSAPLCLHTRNLWRNPDIAKLRSIVERLSAFRRGEADPDRLGPPTPVKQWLAWSLDKTIRLQMPGG